MVVYAKRRQPHRRPRGIRWRELGIHLGCKCLILVVPRGGGALGGGGTVVRACVVADAAAGAAGDTSADRRARAAIVPVAALVVVGWYAGRDSECDAPTNAFGIGLACAGALLYGQLNRGAAAALKRR